jgi:GTP1/Obg family GTP-binding protein
MLNDEIESRISNKNFYEIINKIDYSRTKDHESIKLELFEFKRLLENRF